MQKVMEEIIKKLQTSTVIFSQSNKSDIDKVDEVIGEVTDIDDDEDND